MNLALRPTRGAAVGVAAVEWATGQIVYAAVGNTRAALFGARNTYMDGYAGIVGGGYQRLSLSSFHSCRATCWPCGPTGSTNG